MDDKIKKMNEDIEDLRNCVLYCKNEIFEFKKNIEYLNKENERLKQHLLNRCFVYTDSEDTEDDHDYIDKITNN
jgi:peptidoglycan hydrolase CwlO-like protein